MDPIIEICKAIRHCDLAQVENILDRFPVSEVAQIPATACSATPQQGAPTASGTNESFAATSGSPLRLRPIRHAKPPRHILLFAVAMAGRPQTASPLTRPAPSPAHSAARQSPARSITPVCGEPATSSVSVDRFLIQLTGHLVASGVTLDGCVDPDTGDTLLHACASHRRHALFTWLLHHLVSMQPSLEDQVSNKTPNSNTHSPAANVADTDDAMIAVAGCRLSAALRHLERASSVLLRQRDTLNHAGHTPLDVLIIRGGEASTSGEGEGDDADISAIDASLEVFDREGCSLLDVVREQSLLHTAAFAGNVAVVRLLLAEGIDAMRRQQPRDTHPTGADAVVDLSLSGFAHVAAAAAAPTPVRHRHFNGSPFQAACSKGRTAVVAYMLEEIVARNAHRDDHLSADECRWAQLLQARAAIRISCATGIQAAEQLILQPDSTGRCALHYAAAGQAPDGAAADVIRLLLETAPACIAAKDESGRNATEIALQRGNRQNAMQVLAFAGEAQRSVDAHVRSGDVIHRALAACHLRPQEKALHDGPPRLKADDPLNTTSVIVNNAVSRQYVSQCRAAAPVEVPVLSIDPAHVLSFRQHL